MQKLNDLPVFLMLVGLPNDVQSYFQLDFISKQKTQGLIRR